MSREGLGNEGKDQGGRGGPGEGGLDLRRAALENASTDAGGVGLKPERIVREMGADPARGAESLERYDAETRGEYLWNMSQLSGEGAERQSGRELTEPVLRAMRPEAIAEALETLPVEARRSVFECLSPEEPASRVQAAKVVNELYQRNADSAIGMFQAMEPEHIREYLQPGDRSGDAVSRGTMGAILGGLSDEKVNQVFEAALQSGHEEWAVRAFGTLPAGRFAELYARGGLETRIVRELLGYMKQDEARVILSMNGYEARGADVLNEMLPSTAGAIIERMAMAGPTSLDTAVDLLRRIEVTQAASIIYEAGLIRSEAARSIFTAMKTIDEQRASLIDEAGRKAFGNDDD